MDSVPSPQTFGSRSVTMLGIIAALLGVAVTWKLASPRPDTPAGRPKTMATTLHDGREIVAVFIASSHCAGVNRSGLKEAVSIAMALVGKLAIAHHDMFETAGVAVDARLADGHALLQRFGPFDQEIAGSGWLNSGAVEFLWDDTSWKGPAEVSTIPQLLIVERTLSLEPHHFAFQNSHVLVRRMGADSIIQWADSGAPLPALENEDRGAPSEGSAHQPSLHGGPTRPNSGR